MRALDRSSPARVFRLDRASSSLARRPARPSRVATSPDYLPSQHTSTDRRPFFLSFPSPQAAVVGVSTVLLASPAFAATIKLGGDNGELGFFVSAPYRRSHSRRTRVRPRPIAAASKSGVPLAEIHLDTSASGRRSSLRASRFVFGFQRAFFLASFFFRQIGAKKTHLCFASRRSNRSPTRSPSPRVRPSSS